jgi:glycosyltransferase involved in cell wall biosynthesis
MPAITALLRTHNDALRVGRALETAYPFDEMIVIDHNSQDATLQIARSYGARVISAKSEIPPAEYCRLASHDWIFPLDIRESLSEGLAASLFEWKCASAEEVAGWPACCVSLREETSGGWREVIEPQIRLVPRSWNRWMGYFPAGEPSARWLEGTLLRFQHP